MSKSIKVKSYTIEQDGVKMELVVGKEYQFSDNNKVWRTLPFGGINDGRIRDISGILWVMVREIKVPEVRPCTYLEAVEMVDRLSKTGVLLIRLKAGGGWMSWTDVSLFTHADDLEELSLCFITNGKLGEPMRLEVEV